ncbi:DNA-binding transcriptional regulator, PadR family [Asaccharospora irregularis DSM 2635]|uniref:DNA-binding transcriptional regulator, PadR family n=1 Tax=Asaccharospora irregularis DSM 2635 TaxID=1121321 RepID=A0A1M5TP58_9FIRM|nr:helix-turn-helix transcriptional regulator [Asaccharospora irregularis]SHH52426.1 DNA-binding transcriptional regulator, PadR family [Asaccharospora irregularis DSM 2635]
MNKELIKGSTITLILNTLEKQPMYGYGMIKEIESKSNGVFLFKEGTLYPILHDLEKNKLIESFWDSENGRRRKYYKITKKGLRELRSRESEWELFSRTMSQVLGDQLVKVNSF